MKNATSSNLESVLALIRTLPPKDKETLYQHISLERAVPQWQIDLVRNRKKNADEGGGTWLEGDDFLKAIG